MTFVVRFSRNSTIAHHTNRLTTSTILTMSMHVDLQITWLKFDELLCKLTNFVLEV